MKRIFLLPLVAAVVLGASACQKQQTEAERKAEIEREVQRRLDAERQTDDQEKMAQRQAELEARVEALAAKQKRAVATAAPVATESPAISTSASIPEAESGSYSTFYRKLDPYGDWMETGDYGYVFQPRQAAQSRDWRPYTNGHWIYTDAGWTWISDEKFGWATYHYGRWIRLRGVGWVWVPGEQWAPAWVSWRKGGDYVGWAPLPPEAQFNREAGIHNWADNYYDIGPEQYAFVPANEFGRKLTPREIVPTERNLTIINQTTNITNIVYNNSVIVDRGLSYDDMRSRSRQPIERYRLERTKDPNNEGPVFRGEVVALPAIDFRPPEPAARPKRVVRKIAQPEVERGWSGIQDPEALQKVHAKMKAEATPPPNLPAKRFVRPEQKSAGPSRPTPPKVGRTLSPTAPKAKMEPVGTPAPLPDTPPQAPPTAAPVVTPRPSVAPAISPHRGRAAGRSQPSATPTTPTEPSQVSPTENNVLPKKTDRNGLKSDRTAQEKKRKQRQANRQQKKEERRLQRPGHPEPSPSGAPEQPVATATPSTPKTTTTPLVLSPTPNQP